MKDFRVFKQFVCGSLAGVSMMFMASCGSSKQAQNDAMMMQMMQMMQQQQQNQQSQQQTQSASANSLGVEIAKSPAQQYAEAADATTMRAWASYNGFADDQLEQVAAGIARGELANMLAVFVQNALEDFVDRATVQGQTSDGAAKKKIKDDEVQTKLKVVSEALIKGSKMVRSNRYGQADGTHTAYVCVEIEPKMIAEKIKNDAALINAISDDERLKIAFKSKMFDEEMQSSFERFREEQAASKAQ
ncbi:MAG: hypothetical protein IJZ31_08655 [Bacteroidaceae bacterium]|nr:hypothetical protein [Bacteroidaceae bacterium]